MVVLRASTHHLTLTHFVLEEGGFLRDGGSLGKAKGHIAVERFEPQFQPWEEEQAPGEMGERVSRCLPSALIGYTFRVKGHKAGGQSAWVSARGALPQSLHLCPQTHTALHRSPALVEEAVEGREQGRCCARLWDSGQASRTAFADEPVPVTTLSNMMLGVTLQ